ncbi:SDR family oxidoreductase [Salmonella enterica]|nr:SDR family oxidoreductase [Salmonella enterica]
MVRLKNKVAFITGAASGIGKATSVLFANEGAKLVISDINEKLLNQTADELREITPDILPVKLDVSNESEWQSAIRQTETRYGCLDILFNNAGIYIIKPLLDTSLEQWNTLMSINVTGVFLGMKHAIPLMRKKRNGSIINASSVAGLNGAAGHTLYGASKGAVRIMTKDVAMEFADDNIRVNSIHPGYIKTAMAKYASDITHESEQDLGNKYPLGRLGETTEVAKTVLFLASDDSSYITGCEFVIDGGMTSGHKR